MVKYNENSAGQLTAPAQERIQVPIAEFVRNITKFAESVNNSQDQNVQSANQIGTYTIPGTEESIPDGWRVEESASTTSKATYGNEIRKDVCEQQISEKYKENSLQGTQSLPSVLALMRMNC